MPSHHLTGFIGLKVGPLMLETLIKHYLERIRPSKEGSSIGLRQDELLYDQVFIVVKEFLATAAKNTVEELQEFSNTRTPSPPWVRIVRLTIPMSFCDNAAECLITALGGEEVAKKVVGGTKWWQVRGLKGISAEWMTAKKDLQHVKKRHKTKSKDKEQLSPVESLTSDSGESTYDPDMDEQRCILYLHGGGYYFGSVDQERYSIQRFARKIKGRVFAINYRLSPQYPFPCAIQDAVASYLYLIRPPLDALHQAVNPKHIVVMGDSAGGGLSLALLQVIRDSGLPAPAGGVLVSPWCDMTHSFRSIHENTDSDVLPYYGLCFHKPSILWPPPSEGITNEVHERLKNRIRKVARLGSNGRLKRSVREEDGDKQSIASVPNVSSKTPPPAPELPLDLGAMIQPPNVAVGDGHKFILTGNGEVVPVDQFQLYAPNNLLAHPLISHVGAYLGGLPPLFFIAGDKEVLRDETIYVAHKAAHPERFPLKTEVKNLCPTLNGIESRYGPTQVHLQVYDDCAHVLPVLFPFTTPAKFCFRAVAGFCKYTTGMLDDPSSPIKSSLPYIFISPPPEPLVSDSITETSQKDRHMLFRRKSSESVGKNEMSKKLTDGDAQSSGTIKVAKTLKSASSRLTRSHPNLNDSREEATDVGGPRFRHEQPRNDNERYAGDDPSMYLEPFEMIRERVSIQGVIRPLEPEQELGAFQIEPKAVGAIPEASLRRYIQGKNEFGKRFASTTKTIEKQRQKNLKLAKKEGKKSMGHLQAFLTKSEGASGEEEREVSGSWAWVLDEDERPPPSSIASRRDTGEARRLARIADFMPESVTSGNSLWSHLLSFLTVTPDRNGAKEDSDKGGKEDDPASPTSNDGRTSGLWRDASKSLKKSAKILISG